MKRDSVLKNAQARTSLTLMSLCDIVVIVKVVEVVETEVEGYIYVYRERERRGGGGTTGAPQLTSGKRIVFEMRPRERAECTASNLSCNDDD